MSHFYPSIPEDQSAFDSAEFLQGRGGTSNGVNPPVYYNAYSSVQASPEIHVIPVMQPMPMAATLTPLAFLPEPEAMQQVMNSDSGFYDIFQASGSLVEDYEAEFQQVSFQNFMPAQEQMTMPASFCCQEPVENPVDGMPSVEAFEELLHDHLNSLDPGRRDKTLVSAQRAEEIRSVIVDRQMLNSPRFRFWVRKSFQTADGQLEDGSTTRNAVVLKGQKPVVFRENLYKAIYDAHLRSNHGGRDRTANAVRQYFSGVPKILCDMFVKICPTCHAKKAIQNPDFHADFARPSEINRKERIERAARKARRGTSVSFVLSADGTTFEREDISSAEEAGIQDSESFSRSVSPAATSSSSRNVPEGANTRRGRQEKIPQRHSPSELEQLGAYAGAYQTVAQPLEQQTGFPSILPEAAFYSSNFGQPQTAPYGPYQDPNEPRNIRPTHGFP